MEADYRQGKKYRMRWWTLVVLSMSLIIIGMDNTTQCGDPYHPDGPGRIGLGPLLGGWLLEHFWWGSVFLINVLIVTIA